MKEIKSKSEIPSWFKLDNYINNIKLGLADFYENINYRLRLIEGCSINEHESLKEKIKRNKNKRPFHEDLFNLNKLKNEPILFHNKLSKNGVYNKQTILEKRYEKSDLFQAGIKPISYESIKKLKDKFNILTQRNTISNENNPYLPLSQEEIKLTSLWRDYDAGIVGCDHIELLKDYEIDFYEDNILQHIENYHEKNIRDVEHDFLCDLFNSFDDAKIYLEINMDIPDVILISNFTKILKSLRKREYLNYSHDKIISVTENAESESDKNLNKLINFRVLEFFDLTYWSVLNNKTIPNKIMANVLFPNTPENKNPEGILKSTINFANRFFTQEFLMNIQKQVETSLKIKFSNKLD